MGGGSGIRTKPNVVLVGLMGSGKTSVGRLLSKRLGFAFVDLDAQIEQEAGKNVATLFAVEGEQGFRRRERAAVTRLAGVEHRVVAVGGGAFQDPQNRAALLNLGWCVWLKVSPGVAWQRLSKGEGPVRPLLEGALDPISRLAEISAARNAAYALAHRAVETDGRTPEQSARDVYEALREDRPFDLSLLPP